VDDVVALKSVPLFSDLREPELARLASLVRRETYENGEKIFGEGDAGSAMYFIESGRVRISKELPGMGEEALAILGAGSVFGEMAVLEKTYRSATAVAHETVELLAIDAEAFENLLFVDKELAYYVLRAMTRTLASRLRDTNEKLMTVFLMAQFC